MQDQKPKTWREFEIYVQEITPPSRRESMSEKLGIPGLDPEEDEKEPALTKVRVRFPLEDVTDYYESFNNRLKAHGLYVNLTNGSCYFILTTYDEFLALRIEAGVEVPRETKQTA